MRSFNTIFALALIITLGLSQGAVGAFAMQNNQQAPQTFKPDDSKIVINVPARQLVLFFHGLPVKYYPVGVGRQGFPTPKGKFKVLRKIVDPGWENPYKPSSPNTRIAPGRNNPLGTRWIGFKEDAGGEYGIHGTNRPQSVGQFSSHGCVRMRIADVEEIFDHVTIDTPVEVTYQPLEYSIKGNDLQVKKIAVPLKQYTSPTAQLDKEIQEQFPSFKIDAQKVALALKASTPTPMTIGILDTEIQQKMDRAIKKQAPLPGDEELLDALGDTTFQDVITSNYY